MKSNIISFKKGENKIKDILLETEKVAQYNGLSNKETLRLRLLSEEMSGIIKELVNDFAGDFWIENSNKEYSLNLNVKTDSLDDDTREKLIAVSSSGKNEAHKGFMGKIRSIIELLAVSADVNTPDFYGYYLNSMDDFSMQNSMEYALWSLEKYKEDLKNDNNEDWDELEKSIVANLADNVTVGVSGKKINVVVKKTF